MNTPPFRNEYRIFDCLPVFLDFETYYDKQYSLSKMTYYEYVKDPRFQVIGVSAYIPGDNGPLWVPNHNDDVRKFLNKFDWSDKYMIAHNNWFDGSVMSFHYGIKPRMVGCTSAMARPLFSAFHGTSLAKIMEKLDIGTKGNEVVQALGKRLEHFYPEELNAYGRYCINDTMGCVNAFYIMLKHYQFPRAELRTIDTSIKMYTEPVLQLDTAVLEQHLAAVQARKQSLLEEAGLDVDTLMSNDRLAEWFDEIGVEYPKKWSDKKGLWVPAFAKTDPAFVEMQEHEDETVAAAVSARLGVKSTQEETRTIKLIGQSHWPAVPIQLGYYNAHTGRYGGEGGVNWQNNGRKSPIRRAVLAPPGYTVGAGDSSQIEFRVNMAQSAPFADQGRQDEYETLALIAGGGDPYCDFAGDIYNREVTKDDKDERFVGKQGQLSLGYQGGHGALQRALWANGKMKMPEPERRRVVQVYRTRYTGVKGFWKACQLAIDEMFHGRSGQLGFVGYDQHGIILPNGMRMHYPQIGQRPGEYGPEFFYMHRDRKKRGDVFFESRMFGGKLCENITQALARIIVFYQMNAISSVYKVVKQVHDEVVIIVPDNQVEQARSDLIYAMSQKPAWAKDIPIACEVGFAKNYADT